MDPPNSSGPYSLIAVSDFELNGETVSQLNTVDWYSVHQKERQKTRHSQHQGICTHRPVHDCEIEYESNKDGGADARDESQETVHVRTHDGEA